MAGEGPYETLDEYRNRVTEQSREEKLKEMQHLAQQEFISLYETRVNLRHLELRPYDAENEVFLVTSPEVGEMIIQCREAMTRPRSSHPIGTECSLRTEVLHRQRPSGDSQPDDHHTFGQALPV